MDNSISNLENWLKAHPEVGSLRVAICDLNGTFRGKRVPVDQFRLQKRAGMGLRAIKFRRDGDTLVGLKVLGAGEEVLLVSERGVIVRMDADANPQQSRAATGAETGTR